MKKVSLAPSMSASERGAHFEDLKNAIQDGTAKFTLIKGSDASGFNLKPLETAIVAHKGTTAEAANDPVYGAKDPNSTRASMSPGMGPSFSANGLG